MILLLDTSTPVCRLTLVDGDKRIHEEWQADRELAKGLLGFLENNLQRNDCNWSDLTGLGVFKGPGSFTGLRIGMAVMNTLADGLGVPIVSANGDDWQEDALTSLRDGANEHVALPEYGRPANITKPRK